MTRLEQSSIFEIVYLMPCFQMYKASEVQTVMSKEELYNELYKEVIMWIKSFFKPAIVNKKPCTRFETCMESALLKTKWKDITIDIFRILNIPSKLSYHVLEEVGRLDSLLYKILFPFPELTNEQINANITKHGGWPSDRSQ